MKRRAKPLADHRGDNRGKQWAGIPHCVLDSLAYQHLSLMARAVLVEIVRAMNGYNNGKIRFSQRQLAERLRNSNYRRIGRSIAELVEKGFVDVAAEGQWRPRLAREYRLTFVSTGTVLRPCKATNDYLAWCPVKESGVKAASAASPDSVDAVATETVATVASSSAGSNGKLPNTPRRPADAMSSLIKEPYLGNLWKPKPDPLNGARHEG